MKNKALFALPIALLLATSLFAQTSTELEVGYRWTSISGNEDLYRTQIDEGEGVVVRSFSFFTPQSTGLTDFVRVDASDLGVGPASALRVETGREGAFRLRVGWRSMDAFSALPAYANPLLDQGIIPGQHTWDRERTMFDADLEILASSRITPFIGFSRFRNEGPGTTTYTLGGDDFLLNQSLDETEQEFRVGAAFNTGRIYGSVTQGWRNFESDEVLTLANRGNNSNPVFGVDPSATQIVRDSSLDADTPFTTLYLTGEITPAVKLIGSYVRFSSEGDATDEETATGTFISFPLRRFFNGLDESVTASSKNDMWRGSARAEVALGAKFDLMAGFRTEQRELGGSALLETIFLDTVTFGGIDRRNITELLEAESAIERDLSVFEAAFAGRALGPFSFRVTASQSRYDLLVAPDVHEIVVPGNQGGSFDRKVNTIDATVNFTRSLFNVGVSARIDDADQPIMRTDFTDRERFRVRAGFRTPNNMLRLGVTAQSTDVENTLEGGGFNADSQEWIADAEFAPIAALRMRVAYGILEAESSARIRRPETFAVETWTNDEDGEVLEASIGILVRTFMLDAGLSQFENDGTLPFTVDRWRLRSSYDFLTHYGIGAEWSRDEYDEGNVYGQFEADRFGVFFRYRR